MAGITESNTGLIGATLRHIVGMSMSVEVGAVTARAVAGSHRHYRGRGSLVSVCDTQEQSSGGIMTGGAGVMDLVVTGAERDAGGIARRTCMAAGAFR